LVLAGVLLSNCELADDLPSLLLVVDWSNVDDQTKCCHHCLMNEKSLSETSLNETTTGFRVNVFRDENLLMYSW
jgi:hypothetical protein